jgi:hypothetical protein
MGKKRLKKKKKEEERKKDQYIPGQGTETWAINPFTSVLWQALEKDE